MADTNSVSHRDPAQNVRDFIDALNKCEFDRARDCFSEDFQRIGGPSWIPMGREEYIDMSKRWAAAFPDYKWEIINLVASDKHVAIECIEGGTFTNPWETGGIIIQPPGTAYKDRSCLFIDVNEAGLITAYRYFAGGEFGKAYQSVLMPLMSKEWKKV
jgi:SnoaL-like domain